VFTVYNNDLILDILFVGFILKLHAWYERQRPVFIGSIRNRNLMMMMMMMMMMTMTSLVCIHCIVNNNA